ncbi:MAG: peptidoglycan DD-metalloendopeptidase family protein [Gammaproteobacteria bacterium]|nr:peptidoglycan DD-metalloendopeptidase family protein [Gammaproteobacteria bacterium]
MKVLRRYRTIQWLGIRLLGGWWLLASAPILLALPQHDAVPGGVAVIALGEITTPPPELHFQQRRVLVEAEEQQWFAVVGLGLETEVGRAELEQVGGETIPFTVAPKQYLEQHITLSDKRKVTPYQRDMDRIYREQRMSRDAFRNWRPLEGVNSDFILPVSGIMSSPFGKRRFFNGQPRRPHSGIDIAAPQGTLVMTPGDGVVTQLGEFFFNGNTIFIDHGQGLVSMVCHLDTINVALGQKITQGEVIATVGMTGRVTGPHLHWSVSLNGERVNPLLFLNAEAVALLQGERVADNSKGME